ncbi:MAG: transcription termination factor NusA [Flavobacteriales bacterium AspAUS03]
MDHVALIDSFADFKNEKNIDQMSLMAILEDSIRGVLRKKYGSSDNYDIIVNPGQGDLEIWRNRIVVENGTVEDDNAQIALSAARKIEPDFEIGEEVTEKVVLDDLGRRAVLSLRQNLISKVSEYDNTSIYKKFKDKLGEVIHVEVYHILPRQIIMKDDEQNEMILPKQEQIPNDFFRKGDPIFALVKKVDWKDGKPIAILSRSDVKFLEKLFELEIPEVADKLITVKKIARIPGEKAKVAVESYDDRIDPIGACVGMKGSRIHPIVRELRNENIDVINYTSNNQLYITRALSPAKVSMMEIDEENKSAAVYVKPEEISKAIGRSGQNIRLASQLTGYKINIFRDSPYDDDVELKEFSDEIEPHVIEAFHKIGLDTAKSILDCDIDDLVRRTSLEEKIIEQVFNILNEEFEE